ncbi:MAG: prolyl oligopeptidase family serine peptidase [Halobacteriovoraceae bacterium]|nr:prolyl oligopeptidase family serine peptidase [Halobacteriovoraceae bacterium]
MQGVNKRLSPLKDTTIRVKTFMHILNFFCLLFLYPCIALANYANYKVTGEGNDPKNYFYRPNNFKGNKLPLIVLLHGCNQTASDFIKITQIHKFANSSNFHFISPQQSLLYNPKRCWNWFFKANQEPEGGLELEDIYTQIRTYVQNNNVDEDRIYIAGISAGAIMATNLIFTRPELFAGAILHSGMPYASNTFSRFTFFLDYHRNYQKIVKSMKNGPKKSHHKLMEESIKYLQPEHQIKLKRIMIVHGQDDPYVTNLHSKLLFDQFHFFLEHAVAANKLKTFTRKNKKIEHQKFPYEYQSYISNVLDIRLELYDIDNLGHEWSGGSQGMPYSNPFSHKVMAHFLKSTHVQQGNRFCENKLASVKDFIR